MARRRGRLYLNEQSNTVSCLLNSSVESEDEFGNFDFILDCNAGAQLHGTVK